MSTSKNAKEMYRHFLAYAVLIFSTIAISALAIFTIRNNPDDSKDIFNIVLPVFASWVGTILAFYFDRENFESANKQVRELVKKLAPEERANVKVTSIMRLLRDITLFQIEQGQADEDIRLSELCEKFNSGCSRLPITDFQNKPLYMIHESMIFQYLAAGNTGEANLNEFISWHNRKGVRFEAGSGFVTVSRTSTIAIAKLKMESVSSCQDIFITNEGNMDEPLVGWISNLRLAKFLDG
ncbi:CBS domain-containing protein [Leptothoe sp. LEGE 181152]|nr:CBS domain-containing protein [Leptothoe sp. LEGE 181152]